MAKHQVLFCPFCRESFEGQTHCPEHELLLVSFQRLSSEPTSAEDLLDEPEPLSPWDLRYGRGSVLLGALLNALALGVEFVRFPDGSAPSTLAMASSLPALWSLALVTFTVVFALRRGTSLRALRALRVVVPALGLVSPLVVGWELFRLRQGAVLWAQHVRSRDVELGYAPYLVACASLLIIYGGARLGVVRRA
jgi:hypothetical protein